MSNKVFKSYKDKHKNQRVFMIANGPSLANTNLDYLKDEITIAMNKVSLIYPKNPDWKPTYYLFSSTNVNNPVWGRSWTASVRETLSLKDTTSFVAQKFRNTIDSRNDFPHVHWFSSMSEKKPNPDGTISTSCFSTDIVNRIDKSATTMNLSLQLAYHLGFTEVVIVGADLGFTGDTGSINDPNHFDSSYRADIPPDRVYKINNQMRNAHSLAYKNFIERNKNVKFYNASHNTLLDVYPIIDYEDYILRDKLVLLDEKYKQAEAYWDKPHQFKV
jgi:hypothetical protein